MEEEKNEKGRRKAPPDDRAAEVAVDGADAVPETIELIDGATGEVEKFAEEIDDLRAVAADAGLSIERRLEAYEDIIDSEVGDTALVRGRNLEREFGLRQLYLKFEGGNPSGTQKDRIAFAQAADALRRGFEAITVATCGNYGVAIALAASIAGLRCIIFLPETYHTKRIVEMTELGAEIRRVAGDYEMSVEVSKRFAADTEVYDANPGGENTATQLTAYGQIAYELYDDLRDAPAAVAVPVSNGTTIAGIYRGFLSLFRRGKTSRMPRMVAGSSARKNPIVQALLKNLPSCVDLSPEAIHETVVNEPLINWRSIDGDLALESVRATNGWGGDASDRELSQVSRLLRGREGLDTLPASTAGIIALVERHRSAALPHDRYVAVLTGRKS
ncbi:MAG: pyridoxal-phosphate dependent enzyme [Candidatus Krumholzibacteriota bacterium]|nr:pyridoxal-phosphate dependent enzyme [Candidatus Krumholzibacteriota bacterium]